MAILVLSKVRILGEWTVAVSEVNALAGGVVAAAFRVFVGVAEAMLVASVSGLSRQRF
jgi:hypothetical protein